jgi:hypothetical protein
MFTFIQRQQIMEVTIPAYAIASSSGHTWLDEDGIIIAIGSNQQIHTLEDAIANTKINAALAGGTRRPFLIEMTKVKTMSSEARAFYAGPEPKKSISAVAMVTRSSVGKAVANFFLLLTTPSIPTRMFTSMDEAKVWLRKYKEH